MCQLFIRFSAHALYRLLLLLAQQFSAEKKEGLDRVQCNHIEGSDTMKICVREFKISRFGRFYKILRISEILKILEISEDFGRIRFQ